MSTRCQIEFRVIFENVKNKKTIERRTVYRHSDGYPEGVIPDLKSFLKWNEGRNFDVEDQSANFIYWSKKQNETGGYDPKLGFGICNNDEFHGDIEYYYEVESENKNTVIRVYDAPFDAKSKKDFIFLNEHKITNED